MKRLLLILLWALPIPAPAYSILNNWEGVFYEPGTTITFNFYADLCLRQSDEDAIEQSINYAVNDLNRLDTERTWIYGGRTFGSQWGVWDETTGDATITIECDYPSQFPGALNGMAVPVDNCPNGTMPSDITRCVNGDARYLTDAGVKINNSIPFEYRPAVTTLHEIGHTLGLDHSLTAGATMTTGVFFTETSSQMQETWSRDDYCGLSERFTLAEFPIVRPSIDDIGNLHIPAVTWLGVPWELVMIFNGQNWDVSSNAQPVISCATLKN